MAGEKKEKEWVSWGLIVFLFILGLSPIALVLLFWKLFGKDSQKQSRNRAAATAKKMVRSPVPKKSNARWLKVVGIILLLSGLVTTMDVASYIRYCDSFSEWFWLYSDEWMPTLMLMIGGGIMTHSGFAMDRGLKRYAKYLAVMGDRDAIAVAELAGIMGFSERRVERDLQKMIDKGYFGGKAYLNVGMGYLFRSGEANAAWKEQRQTEQKPSEETVYASVLGKIRQANDRIADPVLSAKIDRMEEITSRIFRAVEEDPRKRDRIDTFLNYYLPTTQKLLDSYAEFEAAGVEGENLRQAKQRIEVTMDSIVRGFEHQLDQLYKADALDVDSDIRVMETMLRRDTAKVSDDFDMGGTAVQQQDR